MCVPERILVRLAGLLGRDDREIREFDRLREGVRSILGKDMI